MAEPGPDAAPESGAERRGVDLQALTMLVAAIGDGDGRGIAQSLEGLHPADAADLLEQLSAEQLRHAAGLAPDAFAGEILADLSVDARAIALAKLPDRAIAAALVDLDSDDATLVIEDAPEERRAAILAAAGARDREAVEAGLAFEEGTAGRLMQREFVAAPEFWTVGDAIDHMRAAGEDELPEMFFEIYVLDPSFRPIGVVSLASLMRRKREVRLADVMTPPEAVIGSGVDQEEAAYLFQKYHLAQAPVVDEAGRLKGILTVDDIVDVIAEENAEDLLALAGVNEAAMLDTPFRQVRARAPWLGVHLLSALGSSVVISFFGATIEKVVALAVLMPIVSALGGSAGGQALAVVISRLAGRELTDVSARRAVASEAAIGLLNGALFAALLAAVAFFWFQDLRIAAVIAVALALTIMWGGLMGILAPLALRRLGADPAVASSVFVMATSDMVGFFLFLGLATAVLV